MFEELSRAEWLIVGLVALFGFGLVRLMLEGKPTRAHPPDNAKATGPESALGPKAADDD